MNAINNPKRPALRVLAGLLLLCLLIRSKACCQSVTALTPIGGTDSTVCLPIRQLQDVAADLAELDQRRATADSAKLANLVLSGQVLTLATALRKQTAATQAAQVDARINRGQALRDTLKTIGNTSLKIGAGALAVWAALHF